MGVAICPTGWEGCWRGLWLRTLHLSVLLEKWIAPEPTPPPPPPKSLPQELTLGSTKGSSDVSSNRHKVDTEVEERVVISLDAIVLQGHSAIELVTCIHLKLACSNIYNMGDAQLDQLALVPGCIPGERAQGELGGGGRSPWSALVGLELAPFSSLPLASKDRDWNQ